VTAAVTGHSRFLSEGGFTAGVPSYWIVVPDRDAATIALAELVLDEQTRTYRYATHYTTDVFRTERPWPVKVDLPALAARMARYRRGSVGGR